MKHFVDDNGTFEINVPSTWKYSLQGGNVHTFQEYEIWKPDSFQISIKPFTDDAHRVRFISANAKLPSGKAGNYTYVSFPDFSHPVIGNFSHTTSSWVLSLDDNIITFTLTHSVNDIDDKPLAKKKDEALKAIASFKLIPLADSQKELNLYRFSMFLQGLGATALILSKAVKNKAFIEATCILGNQIDALLRIGIVLKKQIVNINSDIDKEWIYQGPTDRKKSEKDVYKEAETLGVITEAIRIKLYELYEDRNRVVHRFIISEITIAEIENIAFNYHQLSQKINKIIYDIEEEQITLNIGMTKRGTTTQSEEQSLDFIRGKIGKESYFDESQK